MSSFSVQPVTAPVIIFLHKLKQIFKIQFLPKKRPRDTLLQFAKVLDEYLNYITGELEVYYLEVFFIQKLKILSFAMIFFTF